VRAEAAAEEILRGELLKSVATDVDCKHPSALTRLFKRVKGTTPTDYRDKHGDVSNR
jgi:AraC-like DNA-binding protein